MPPLTFKLVGKMGEWFGKGQEFPFISVDGFSVALCTKVPLVHKLGKRSVHELSSLGKK